MLFCSSVSVVGYSVTVLPIVIDRPGARSLYPAQRRPPVCVERVTHRAMHPFPWCLLAKTNPEYSLTSTKG
jgi:hypothetical protein